MTLFDPVMTLVVMPEVELESCTVVLPFVLLGVVFPAIRQLLKVYVNVVVPVRTPPATFALA